MRKSRGQRIIAKKETSGLNMSTYTSWLKSNPSVLSLLRTNSKTLPWLAIGVVLSGIALFVSTISVPVIKVQPGCWVWKEPDIELAQEYKHWVLYQGDIIADNSNIFVKRGVMPVHIEDHELTLLFRIYALPDVELLAKQVSYAIEQWEMHDTNIQSIQLDYDAASSELARYARYVRALKHALPDIHLSITGLVSWYDDNFPDLITLGAEVEYIAFQLYQNYAPLARAEQYASRLTNYPYPYKLGITMHEGFSEYRFKEGPHYLGDMVFINSRKR